MELEKEKARVSVTLIHPGRIDTPYNEHARSYMPKQPAHRGMISPPEAVAEAILYAAEHPKRGWIRSGSLYVKAEKHPVLTTMAVASLGVTILLLEASRF